MSSQKDQDAQLRHLAAACGMVHQRCSACNALLEAYSRENDLRTRANGWSCPSCKVPGATVACLAHAPEAMS